MIISDEEKRTIAYHEAGHALVADLLPGADPVHKVTIIPRGRALGLTQQLPTDDKYNYSREYLINRITILLGGRAAEEMVFQQQTTGAGQRPREGDRDGAQDGLRVGHVREARPADLRQAGGAHLPGPRVRAPQDYSEETAVLIDAEIKRIVIDCAARARAILEEQIGKLHRLAKALLEHESLDAEEIARVLAVEPHGALEGAPA